MTRKNFYSINLVYPACITLIMTVFFGCHKSIEIPFAKISAPIPLGEYEVYNQSEIGGDSYLMSVHWVGGPNNTFEICNFLNERITITGYLQKDHCFRIPNQEVSNAERQISIFEGEGKFGSSDFELSVWLKPSDSDDKAMEFLAQLHD